MRIGHEQLAGGPASTPASSAAQPSATSAPPSTIPTTPQIPPSSPAVPACSPSGLTGAVPSGEGGAAAGSAYYPLNLTNTSGKSCYLYGYPGVSFVTSPSGSQIGAAASRNPAVTPATVVLAPGQTAHVTVQVVDALNYSKADCKPVTAHWLKIYPPGQYGALYVKFTAMTCSPPCPPSWAARSAWTRSRAARASPAGGCESLSRPRAAPAAR